MFSNINKPAFGPTAASTSFGFGASTSQNQNPFGQSQLFGKTPTTGFGAPAAGAFGQPANNTLFSQPQTSAMFPSTQTSAFGAGAPTQTTFGSNIFGQQPQAAQPAASTLFGQTTAFGQQAKPAGFGFASTPQAQPSIFGQQPTPQTSSTSLFNASGGSTLFGGGSTFGGTGVQNGTSIKFNPVTGTDTMQKNGVAQSISTKHHCITCMKEYESKSLEELRFEDYQLNRKGPQQPQQQQQGFGGAPFGGSVSVAPTLFGQTAENKPAFGQSNGFGQNTFGAQAAAPFGMAAQQPQANNLFGKSTTFGAPSSSANTFGGFNAPTTGTTNLFGSNQAKPFGAPASTSLFGSTMQQPQTQATSSFGATGGLFGQPASQQNSSTTLFGAPKQTTPFNATNNFTFTSAAQPTNNLFQQQKPATTGFGVGMFGMQQQSTFSTNANPTFGQQQSTTGFGGSSFGKPLTFGQQPQTQQPSLLFGQNPQQSSSLFSMNQQQQKPGGLFNSSGGGLFSNFQSTSVFGQGNQQNTQQTTSGQFPVDTSQEIKNLPLATDQFGHSPHLSGLSPVNKSSSVVYATNPTELKKILDTSKKIDDYQTVSRTKLKLCAPKIHRDNLFDEINDDELNRFYKNSCKRLVIKTKNGDSSSSIFDPGSAGDGLLVGRSEVLDGASDADPNRAPPPTSEELKLDLSFAHSPRQTSDKSRLNLGAGGDNIVVIKSPDARFGDGNNSNRPSATEITDMTNITANITANKIKLPSEQDLDSSRTPSTRSLAEAHPCAVVSTRVEYYTLPAVEELPKYLNEDGTCLIKGFTIGRRGYGNVYFPDEIDVRNLNLDEIVHFRYKEITMYPDENNKPPVGEGLNRRAQVTLDKIFPRVKGTKEIIDDVDKILEAKFPDQLRDISAKHGLKFVDFRPETGSWVFMVEHFSKYAFTESDEECCEYSPEEKAKMEKQKAAAAAALKAKEDALKQAAKNEAVVEPSYSMMEEDEIESERGDILQKSLCVDLEDSYDFYDKPFRSIKPGNQVQIMKSTFFDMEESYDSMSVAESESHHRDLFTRPSVAPSELTINELEGDESPSEDGDLPLIMQCNDLDINDGLKKPMRKSAIMRPQVTKIIVNTQVINDGCLKNLRCVSDVGMFKGKSFKVGWSSGVNAYVPHQLKTLDYDGPYSLWKVGYAAEPLSDTFKKCITDNLEAVLTCSNCTISNGVPTFEIKRDLTYLMTQNSNFRFIPKDKLNPKLEYLAEIWRLCNALWGPGRSSAPFVKARLSRWLQETVEKSAPSAKTTSEDDILALITCYQLERAADLALKLNYPNLALLIAQAHSSPRNRQNLQTQLEAWEESTISDHISETVRKIYTVLAGLPHKNVNVFDNLDWKRAFGGHLWYVSTNGAPLEVAIEMYGKSFTEHFYAARPLPPYLKDDNEVTSNAPFDVLYHILQVYKNKAYGLAKVLDTSTHTSDPVDYSLSWPLLIFFKSLPAGLITENEESLIHTSYSTYLEQNGLWDAAILPLLFLKNATLKKNLVMGLLHRNMGLKDTPANEETQNRIVNEFHIPAEWLHSIKGHKHNLLGHHWQACAHLTQAKEYIKAHDLFMRHVLPSLFVNNKVHEIKVFINVVSPAIPFIATWNNELGLIARFFQLENSLGVASSNAELLEVQRDLIDLCQRLKTFPIHGVLHKLCVAEISKRCMWLYEGIGKKLKQVSLIPRLEDMLDNFVMPPDYSQLSSTNYLNELLR